MIFIENAIYNRTVVCYFCIYNYRLTWWFRDEPPQIINFLCHIISLQSFAPLHHFSRNARKYTIIKSLKRNDSLASYTAMRRASMIFVFRQENQRWHKVLEINLRLRASLINHYYLLVSRLFTIAFKIRNITTRIFGIKNW